MCKVIAEINKFIGFGAGGAVDGQRKEKLWTCLHSVVCLPRASIGLDLSSGRVEREKRDKAGQTVGRTDRQAARLIDNIDTDASNCNADYIMIYVNWRGRHETLKGDHMGKMRVLILFVV